MYLYRTTIFTSTDNVYGIDVAQNNADKTDFETNFKNQTLAVDDVIIAETVFVTDLSFTAFKAKIVSPVLWSDVKRMEKGNQYILNLVVENPI